MDNAESFLKCSVSLQWENQQGTIVRQVNHKLASIRITRNELRDMYLEVSNEKHASIKLALKQFNVFKKFMAEGKASIKLQEDLCTIFLSNAPPTSLVAFLRTIFVKMVSDKEHNGNKNPLKTLRAKLLSDKASSFDDISPVTNKDLQLARKKISLSTDTTPSPPSKKRKPSTADKSLAPKKLYSSSIAVTCSLNPEQKRVLDACLSNKNVFFTGSAGTGKSFLLKRIITALPPDVTVATASTGVAACHIGGTTLHAFAGIGDGSSSLNTICERVTNNSLTSQRWKKVKHLIIDEISMVEGSFFEKLEAVAKYVRKNDKPFGGIQLILCGDFLQLPPVMDNKQKTNTKFCFQSACWEKCVQLYFELKEVHRQKDQEFISILNSIRIGCVTPTISDKLKSTAKQKIECDGILATRLCSHTNDSKLINTSKLKDLAGEEKVFFSQDSENCSNLLDMQTIAPAKVALKTGAQVMLLKNININAGLVNGARGVVVRFEDGFPVVRFKNKKEYTAKMERWYVKTSNGSLICRKQVPLNLAWAFSIHKSQGLTLDCVEMSLSKIFEAGQAYVALSRAQSLDTLRVLDFDSRYVWADQKVLEFYQRFRKRLKQMEIIPLGRPLSEKTNKSSLRAIIEKRLRQ